MEYRQYTHKSEKFGGKYFCDKCASGHPLTIEKRRKTCQEKYGTDNPMQVQEIAIKVFSSFVNNGNTVSTSKQQQAIYDYLSKKYPKVELNKLVGTFSLDCFMEENTIKIDIEYDGWYWHQDKAKDDRRDSFLKAQGYKVLRIKSGNLLPNFQDLDKAIEILLKEDINYYEIILNDYKL